MVWAGSARDARHAHAPPEAAENVAQVVPRAASATTSAPRSELHCAYFVGVESVATPESVC